MVKGLSTLQSVSANELMRYAGVEAYLKGQQIYKQTPPIIESMENGHARVQVEDKTGSASRVFVDVDVTPRGQFSFTCTCPDDERGICRHGVAAVFALKDRLAHRPAINRWETTITGALQAAPAPQRKAGAVARPALLAFCLQKRSSSWSVHLYSLPASRFSEDALNDAEAAARTIADDTLSPQATRVRTVESAASSASRFINLSADERRAAVLAAAMAQQYGYGYYSYGMPDNVGQILPLLNENSLVFTGTEQDPLNKRLPIRTHPRAHAQLRAGAAKDGGLSLQPVLAYNGQTVVMSPKNADILLKDPTPYLIVDHALYALEDTPSPAFYALLSEAAITVPAADRARFVEKYLLPLAERVPLAGDAFTYIDAPDTAPEPRLYLSEDAADKTGVAALRAHLRFGYGEQEAPYDASLPSESVRQKADEPGTLYRVHRHPEEEQQAFEKVNDFGLKRDTQASDGGGWFRLRARTDAVDFLMRQAPRLVEAGYSIYGEESLTQARVNRNKPTLSLRVSSGIDWFDVEAAVEFGDVSASLKDVRAAIRRREKYVKLADGTIGMIPDDWIERYRHLFALSEETEDGLRLSTHHALLLDQAIEDAEGGNHAADAAFSERKQRLRDGFSTIQPRDLPPNLHATLYPYQKSGYDWLHFLHDYGFGGCLADDMGLGKTVTALAFLLSLRQRANGEEPHTKNPDLIVLPRSLLFNWEREAQRFAPDLKVLIYADGSRAKDPATLGEYDLILTTYGILLRDIEMLRAYPFHYALLDEAQAVKNPLAQTSRAARLLTAEHRLTLTGTPVENGTLELWSQFAFLNPGLLGNLEGFKENFAGAIERKQDEKAANTLRKLIQPFLLRRTKDQVARELPPRTDSIRLIDMDAAQRKLYGRIRDYYRSQVMGLLDEGGGGGSTQIKILEGLLRLRQVCNHPQIVEPEYKGDSAKYDALMETLETLRSEGHKALVFSQFVQMLKVVREGLDGKKIPYVYLDGRTRDRQARVDQFQNEPEIPFFLISLKAGGVGLNLTAADYVLHIDPWWNPAVEQQATDRAHRIGQTKPVFVDKFIVKDTVEEKILTLQERKRNLANQLISTEESFFKSLTRDDIHALFT